MCKKRKNPHVHIRRHDNDMMSQICEGLRHQGLTVYSYADLHNLDRRKTVMAILGIWNSKKARQRRNEILAASHAHRLSTITPITRSNSYE